MNSKKVSELLGVSTDTLRYYERIGVIPPVERDHNGYRVYKTNDLNWIYLAKSLRGAGLSIESLIEFATLARKGGAVRSAQKDILHEQLATLNEKLAKMKETQALLQYKIDTFDGHLAKFDSGEMNKDNVEELWEKPFLKHDKGEK
ncbi:MerR family transcriptional regulator [Lentilactobacillus otakiensis]|uniref:MerR family transcriptional regulator n=1 Tax=Lentilactobacillus otakiensis TaxID=481720 RepID=UPI003D16BF04